MTPGSMSVLSGSICNHIITLFSHREVDQNMIRFQIFNEKNVFEERRTFHKKD